ncbi:MAG TPA: histidine kinase dimerization/phospho-acceptor domain-containing protein [Candidatus Limnocylindrales bacterium]|nr:histidine kinase dimerization/phospho-acceptor domain-containing protein [Candidatus Limnocylindrales bacterium]
MLDQQGGTAEPDPGRTGGPRIVRADRPDAPPNPVSRPAERLVLQGLQVVVDRLPEAVLVTRPDGGVELTNAAADRLFADRPVRTAADLLSRFDGIGGTIAAAPVRPDEPPRRLTIRPRHQPNTWYALDRVPFEAVGPTPPPADHGSSDGQASDGAATGRDPGAAATTGDGNATVSDPAQDAAAEPAVEGAVGSVWVLRDVTNSSDLHAEREAFLAVLSHELRTPLTTIYAGSSVLARRGRLSPPATRTLALDISAEAARLYELVENLLVIARLERRILEPLDESVDLGQVLDAAIRTTGDRFPDARIVREGARRPPPVRGDTTYVEQACRNLLLAGLRVAGDNAEPVLVVRADLDRERGEVAVRVFDRGPSLSETELGQAFDLASESTSGRLEGTGMGPFVVRHVIEAMNGRTWARNRDGGGLEMGFALRIDDRS